MEQVQDEESDCVTPDCDFEGDAWLPPADGDGTSSTTIVRRSQRFALPGISLAFGLSLLVHGAVVAAGIVWLVRTRSSSPLVALGGGPTSLTTIPDGRPPRQEGLPGDVAVPTNVVRERSFHATEKEAEFPAWDHGSQPKADTDPVETGEIFAPFGAHLAACDAAPSFHHHADKQLPPSGGEIGAPGALVDPQATVGNGMPPGLPSSIARDGVPPPEYPLEARRRGEQGVVKVLIEVLPNGSLGQIVIAGDPGFPLLRSAALAAAQRLRAFDFTPARDSGRPVRGYVTIPYVFALRAGN